jgi:hypothetical protein
MVNITAQSLDKEKKNEGKKELKEGSTYFILPSGKRTINIEPPDGLGV